MIKDSVPRTTPAPLDVTIEELRRLLPGAFSAGRIDCEKLREAVGDAADTGVERYAFTWAGKQDAIRLLQVPSRATLAPCTEESIDFDTTGHLFIEGDNLEVLKLLYRPYFGRVKMIYIDPPYNTGNDFVYRDDFADPLARYLEMTGQADSAGNLLTSNPETSGRYHSTWLSMMYPRLFLARQLLSGDGLILISIDDVEVANLKLLMNELFGEENFVAHIVWQKRYVSNVTARLLSDMHDHILVYARDSHAVQVHRIPRTEDQLRAYKNPDDDPRGPWRAQDLSASKQYTAGLFTITTPAGVDVNPPPGRYWRCNRRQYDEWLADNRIWFGVGGHGRPMLKAFLSESQDGVTPHTWWDYGFAGHNKEATLEVKDLFDGASPFDTAKPVRLVKRMIELFTERDSLVMDFFAGSATTGHAVLAQNQQDDGCRRLLLVQLPEPIDGASETGKNALRMGLDTISAVGMERMRRAAARFQADRTGQLDLSSRAEPEDLGFRVFKLRPSNYRQWAGVAHQDPAAYTSQMEIFTDPLVDGWKPDDVLWEIALKEGFGLSSRVEALGLATNNVSRVADLDVGRQLFACLDDNLAPETMEALGLTKDDLFICRDVALTDELAANLALQCRLKTI